MPEDESQAPTTSKVSGSVTGLIREQDGTPIAGCTVRVYNQELRALTMLAEGRTDAKGNYALEYESSQLGPTAQTGANLVLKAFDANNNSIAESATLFQAPQKVQIILTRDNLPYLGPAQSTTLASTLAPSLGNVAAASLTPEDIAFLNGATGLSTLQIEQYSFAMQSAAATGQTSDLFYGLSNEGLPSSMTPLLSVEASAQLRALQSAAASNLIAFAVASQSARILSAFRQQSITQTLVPGSLRLGATLSTAFGDSNLESTLLGT